MRLVARAHYWWGVEAGTRLERGHGPLGLVAHRDRERLDLAEEGEVDRRAGHEVGPTRSETSECSVASERLGK